MSSSNQTSSDETIDDDTRTAVITFSLFIGSISPKYSYLTSLDVMGKYSEYMEAVNGSIVVADMVKLFGSKPADLNQLIGLYDGPDSFVYTVTAIYNGIRPLLPHPTAPDIVLPLFAGLTVLTGIALVLRLWSRHRVAGAIQLFDWLAVFGFALTIALGALCVVHSNAYGHFQSNYDKSWDNIRETYVAYFSLTALYPWAIMTIKLSLLLFYYRMTTTAYIRWTVYITTAITVANTFASFFFQIFGCSHVNYWDYLIYAPCKINRRNVYIATGAIYILTDIIIWIMPMPLVFRLKLAMREKILAVFTFSIGGIACVASVMRLIMILRNTYASSSNAVLLIDAWTIIELNLALICACAPAIRALVIFFAPKLITRMENVTASLGRDAKDSEKSVSETQVTPTKSEE